MYVSCAGSIIAAGLYLAAFSDIFAALRQPFFFSLAKSLMLLASSDYRICLDRIHCGFNQTSVLLLLQYLYPPSSFCRSYNQLLKTSLKLIAIYNQLFLHLTAFHSLQLPIAQQNAFTTRIRSTFHHRGYRPRGGRPVHTANSFDRIQQREQCHHLLHRAVFQRHLQTF